MKTDGTTVVVSGAQAPASRSANDGFTPPEQNLRLGALLAIVSGACFASMGAMIKLASVELNNEMVVFLRSVFGLLVLLPWLVSRGLDQLATERVRLHFFRAVVGLTAMYCFFYAIPRLNLAEAVLLNYSAPLFVPLIAWVWLGERPLPRALIAIPVGLLGVIMIIKPGMGIVSFVGMIGVFSGIFAAFAMVGIRRLSTTEPYTRIVFYFSAFGVLITAVPLLWSWQSPSTQALLLMALAGGFATSGQLLLTRAYGVAPAVNVASLTYTAVAFSALLGWLIWSEIPDRWSWIGMAVVAFSAVVTVHQRRLKPASRRSDTKLA